MTREERRNEHVILIVTHSTQTELVTLTSTLTGGTQDCAAELGWRHAEPTAEKTTTWARDENVGDLARSFGAYRSVIPPGSYRIPR